MEEENNLPTPSCSGSMLIFWGCRCLKRTCVLCVFSRSFCDLHVFIEESDQQSQGEAIYYLDPKCGTILGRKPNRPCCLDCVVSISNVLYMHIFGVCLSQKQNTGSKWTMFFFVSSSGYFCRFVAWSHGWFEAA